MHQEADRASEASCSRAHQERLALWRRVTSSIPMKFDQLNDVRAKDKVMSSMNAFAGASRTASAAYRTAGRLPRSFGKCRCRKLTRDLGRQEFCSRDCTGLSSAQ